MWKLSLQDVSYVPYQYNESLYTFTNTIMCEVIIKKIPKIIRNFWLSQVVPYLTVGHILK